METLDLAASPPSIAFGGNRYKAILRLALPTVFAMLVAEHRQRDRRRLLLAPARAPSRRTRRRRSCRRSSSRGSSAGASAPSASARRRSSRGATPRATARRRARCSATRRSSASRRARSSRSWASLLLPWLVRSMIEVPEVQDVAIAYTRWRLLAVISMAATMAIKAFFDGIGKTYVHLVAVDRDERRATWCSAGSSSSATSARRAWARPARGSRRSSRRGSASAIMVVYAWAAREDYQPDALREPLGQDDLVAAQAVGPGGDGDDRHDGGLRPLRAHRGRCSTRATTRRAGQRGREHRHHRDAQADVHGLHGVRHGDGDAHRPVARPQAARGGAAAGAGRACGSGSSSSASSGSARASSSRTRIVVVHLVVGRVSRAR